MVWGGSHSRQTIRIYVIIFSVCVIDLLIRTFIDVYINSLYSIFVWCLTYVIWLQPQLSGTVRHFGHFGYGLGNTDLPIESNIYQPYDKIRSWKLREEGHCYHHQDGQARLKVGLWLYDGWELKVLAA